MYVKQLILYGATMLTAQQCSAADQMSHGNTIAVKVAQKIILCKYYYGDTVETFTTTVRCAAPLIAEGHDMFFLMFGARRLSDDNIGALANEEEVTCVLEKRKS